MAKNYPHVTLEERSQISGLKSTGISLRKIAKIIGKSVSTISREISRNSSGVGYLPSDANILAKNRRTFASRRPTKITGKLKEIIIDRLERDWSPEQISGRLKNENIFISYESIYRFVWKDKRSGGLIYKHLRHHGKRYNKRSSGKAGRGCIPNRVDISMRPKIVEEKTRIGDWEGDTIIGAKHKGAIFTCVDRMSKFVIIEKLDRKTAACVVYAAKSRMSVFSDFVHTITLDNGKEFAGHKEISKILTADCFFATPYKSCERGLNEHTNGLIRKYIPKSTSFDKITRAMIQTIENNLNHRPRKCLNYRTPFEVFFEALSSSSSVALQC